MRNGTVATGTVLDVRGLCHAYDGVRLLNGIALDIAAGEIVTLVGASGSGKTTLLRLIVGIEPVQRGTIVIHGRTVAGEGVHVPPEMRAIGMVFQDFALFPHLTVARNVGFGLRRWPRPEREARVDELLGKVGLADYAGAYPHVLSGGQQQRVALVRALAPRPKLLLLDEPFSGLDAALRSHVREETLELLRETHTAVLMVTHDSEEAMFMSDRLAVLEGGRVVQMGTPDEIYRRPATAFVATLFGEVNRFEGTVEQGWAHTVLAPVPAGAFADGTSVEVLIRPEAISLKAPDTVGKDGAASARVIDSHLLGGASVINLVLDGGTRSVRVTVRRPGVVLPPRGTRVDLELDPTGAFVFARNG